MLNGKCKEKCYVEHHLQLNVYDMCTFKFMSVSVRMCMNVYTYMSILTDICMSATV